MNARQAATVPASSMTSASCWTRPTSHSTRRTASGGAITPSNRKAGAEVRITIGSSARARTALRTSAVRVACPYPCPET